MVRITPDPDVTFREENAARLPSEDTGCRRRMPATSLSVPIETDKDGLRSCPAPGFFRCSPVERRDVSWFFNSCTDGTTPWSSPQLYCATMPRPYHLWIALLIVQISPIATAQPTPLEIAADRSCVATIDNPWSGLVNPACIQTSESPILMAWSTAWPSALREGSSGGAAFPLHLLTHDGLISASGTTYRDYCDLTFSIAVRHAPAADISLGIGAGARVVSIAPSGLSIHPVLEAGFTNALTDGPTIGGCWTMRLDSYRSASHELTVGWEYRLDNDSRLCAGLYGSTSGERTASIGLNRRIADNVTLQGCVSFPGNRLGLGASVVSGPVLVDLACASSAVLGALLSLGVTAPM